MKQRATFLTRSRMMAVASATVVSTLLVACGDDGAGVATTGSSTTVSPPTEPGVGSTTTTTTTVAAPVGADASLIYFTRGQHLVASGRNEPAGTAGLEASLRAVLSGPNQTERDDADIRSAVPAGSELRSVTVSGALATVDMSAPFGTGDAESMRLRIAQIVFTATETSGVQQVSITIEGKDLDGADAAARSSFDDVLPPILVQRPVPGQVAGHELEVSGLANVFEGTVNIEVVDATGAVIAKGFGTGSMGQWGPFETTITIPAGVRGALTVRCFEVSPKDGSIQNLVETPVMLSA